MVMVLFIGASSGREAREKGEKERGTATAQGGGKERKGGKNGYLLREKEKERERER